MMSFKQVYRRPGLLPDVVVGLPTVIRKPCSTSATSRSRGERLSHRLEGRYFCLAVGVEVLLEVVDGHASSQRAQKCIWVLWYTLIGAIPSFEVHHGSPIVAARVSGHVDSNLEGVYLRSSEKEHVVQVAFAPMSPLMVALKALPPTIYIGMRREQLWSPCQGTSELAWCR